MAISDAESKNDKTDRQTDREYVHTTTHMKVGVVCESSLFQPCGFWRWNLSYQAKHLDPFNHLDVPEVQF